MAFYVPRHENRIMDKWSYRYYVTQDLMLFAIAIEALTLYPTNPLIFLGAVPIGMGSLIHLFRVVMRQK
jgi:hypothetical protein